jgi:uncharacterized protein
MTLRPTVGLSMNAKNITQWLFKHSKALFFLSVTLFFISIFGLSKFSFVTDLHFFFNEDNVYKKEFDKLSAAYSRNDFVIVALVEKDKGSTSSLLNPEAIEVMQTITRTLNDLPFVSTVESIVNSRYSYIDEEGFLASENLFPDTSNLSNEEFQTRVRYGLDEKLLRGRIVSENQKMLVAYAKVEWENANHDLILNELSASLEQLEATLQTTPYQTLITGKVWLEKNMIDLAVADSKLILPIVMILCFFVLLFVIRSLSLIIIAMTGVFASILMAFGVFSWLGISHNQVSIMAANLILVIVIASTIHFLINFLQFYKEGFDKETALFKSYEINLRPVFFTVLTTAMGFLMLNLADSPPYKLLGNAAFLGIFLGLFLLLCMFPFLILNIPFSMPKNHFDIHDYMGRVGEKVLRYHRQWLVFFSCTIVTLACFIPMNKLNDDPFTYFDESMRFRQDTELFTKTMAGRKELSVSIDSGEEGGVNEPLFLSTIEQFTQWLEEQPDVKKVFEYSQVIKSINKATHNLDEVPLTRAESAELIFSYELNLPENQSLDQFVTHDKSAAKTVIILGLLNNNQMLALEKSIKDWLHKHASDYEYTLASNDLMYAALGKSVLERMTIGSLLAIISISMLLILGLKSLKYGLLSMVPNAMPAIIVYGLWGLFVGEVNMAVAITFSLALGLVVDDTVHLLSKYLDARKRGENVEDALISSYRVTSPALILTTVLITVGCVVQVFSLFGVNALVGALTGLMVVVALIFDLLFLPGLIILFEKRVNKSH